MPRRVGVYTLNCTRADNVATLTFENTLAATPEPQATPDGTAPEEEGVNEEEGSLAGMMADKGKSRERSALSKTLPAS